MTRTFLSLAALLAVSAEALAAGACPPARPQVVLERFISADCAACWAQTPPNPVPGRPAFVIDWIVSSAAGDQAPLAAAALSDAKARVTQAGTLRDDEALTLSHPLPERSALAVEAASGPAWNDYIALRVTVSYTSHRPLPKDLSAWIALVERIPAGEDGSPVDRQLVRVVDGPLPLENLAQAPVEHLRATRVPASGKSERLGSVAWVQTSKGRVLAVAHGETRDCPVR